jgi:transcriptional regulator with XRE-family HTH domain
VRFNDEVRTVAHMGELLRGRRIAHGLSQDALAGIAQTHQPAISRIERGACSPSVETLTELFAALGEELVLVTRPAGPGSDDASTAAARLRIGTLSSSERASQTSSPVS